MKKNFLDNTLTQLLKYKMPLSNHKMNLTRDLSISQGRV